MLVMDIGMRTVYEGQRESSFPTAIAVSILSREGRKRRRKGLLVVGVFRTDRCTVEATMPPFFPPVPIKQGDYLTY